MNTGTGTGERREKSGIVVVGSANLDVVFTVERIPKPGETLLARSTARYPGGKGLNQAVASARAGAPTRFVCALGQDENGRDLLAAMAQAGIDSGLVRTAGEASGQAFIVVDASAENTIIVASGSNATMTSLTGPERDAIASSRVLLMQSELPLGIVEEAAGCARGCGTLVMLNAAPAGTLPDALVDSLDYLIVNEHEACLTAGSDDLDEASAILASRVGQLIVTLGADGSVLYAAGAEVARVPARKVRAIDTTGAGDTFCGAFAAAIAEGQGFVEAAEFATAAAALSVQSVGAVPSIPSRARIDAERATAR